MKFFTFSSKRALGASRLFFKNLSISRIKKNTFPLSSSNPLWYPAKEKAWQGNPAANTSTVVNSGENLRFEIIFSRGIASPPM